MKKIFALSTTLCVLLFASSIFADTTTSFNSGESMWWVADLEGDPSKRYGENGNGKDFLAQDLVYREASIVSPLNGAWADGIAGKWIGPAEGSGGNHSRGYTVYMASGYSYNDPNNVDLRILFSADNALTNMFFVAANGTMFDLFSDACKDFVKFNYDDAGDNYNGPEYTSDPDYTGKPGSPYNEQGLFQGYGYVDVAWEELLAANGLTLDTVFDVYCITQNTNPSNGDSPSAFAIEFSGFTPSNTTTPEPATLAIMGLGFLGAGIAARRRNK